MTNEWYEVGYSPRPETRARSSVLAGEFKRVEKAWDKVPSPGEMHTHSFHTCGDESGSANAFHVRGNHCLKELIDGAMVRFEASFANTGAATLQIDHHDAVDLLRANGKALESGDIGSGDLVQAVFDGTAFRVTSLDYPTPAVTFASLQADLTLNQNEAMTAVVLPAVTDTSPTYTLSALPAGLTFAAATRTISGTPTAVGDTDMTYTATAGGKSSTLTFSIKVINELILGEQEDVELKQGDTYNGTDAIELVTASKGTSPYSYSIEADTLPDGVAFDSVAVKLSGTPTVHGTFAIELVVTDSSDPVQEKTAEFDIVIEETKPLKLGVPSAIGVEAGEALAAVTIDGASDGKGPYTYTVTGLPAGLTWDSDDLDISGTVTAAGTYQVTIKVTDAQSSSVSKTFPIYVWTPYEKDDAGDFAYTWPYTGAQAKVTMKGGRGGQGGFGSKYSPYWDGNDGADGGDTKVRIGTGDYHTAEGGDGGDGGDGLPGGFPSHLRQGDNGDYGEVVTFTADAASGVSINGTVGAGGAGGRGALNQVNDLRQTDGSDGSDGSVKIEPVFG